ncbi:unnamed protein product [Pylaiella littoralis]
MSGSGSELGGAVSAVFFIQISIIYLVHPDVFSFRSLFFSCVLRLDLVCWSFTCFCTHVFAIHKIHPWVFLHVCVAFIRCHFSFRASSVRNHVPGLFPRTRLRDLG